MNPKLEKLIAEKERNEREVEILQHRQQRLENRLAYIEGKERKARTHRLVTRGAAVEHLWPQVTPMSETTFYELMEKVLALPEAESILRSSLPEGSGDP